MDVRAIEFKTAPSWFDDLRAFAGNAFLEKTLSGLERGDLGAAARYFLVFHIGYQY
jgi:hypothetical protein